jgi:glycosyltransferase involved in cell wall biosynthesis
MTAAPSSPAPSPAGPPPAGPGTGSYARKTRTPLSAVLIVKDGELHLDRVLAALAWCDDLLVLDSGSRDRTLDIARERGARIAHQEFLGYGRQKQRAVELARHDWVLVIDADEVLDDQAAAAIRALDLSDPARAWRIRRRTYIGAREVRHGQWSPDYSLRLFNRTRAGFDLVAVHEAVRPAGPVLTLPVALHHYSYRDHAEVFTRLAAYARMKSWDYRQRGRRAGGAKLVLRAFWGFLRSYVFKLGFLDGVDGVIVAMSLALDCVLALALADGPLSVGGAASGGAPNERASGPAPHTVDIKSTPPPPAPGPESPAPAAPPAPPALGAKP